MSFPDQQSQTFRLLVETASCMIVILREDGTIAYFNPFAERLTGYKAGDVVGQPYLELFLPDEERPGVSEQIQLVFGGGHATPAYENPVICLDRSLRWLEWNAQLLEAFEGERALLAIGHDITDRKRATEELLHEKACLRAVLDTAVDGVITIDEHGVIQSVNAASERIFGYKSEQLQGHNISMLMPSPYREEHDGYLQNYLRTGVRKIIGIGREVEALRKDGTTFPCDIAVSEVPLPGQRLFTGVVRDISRQKKAEERALQAERLAAIGQTVAGLAHESRNAFQRSHACLEMLALELEGRPEELELVERTQRALDHLHRLYEEVRDYAAPIKLDRHQCDVPHLWRDAWSQLEVSRQDKSVKLDETITSAELSCNIDWFAIGQVFRNILENAIVACDKPGLIEIDCRDASLCEKAALRVSIRDNGPGIERQHRSQVFDAFFTTRSKGTGLGLAIVKRIVEAHDGTIEIGDGPGGAEFIITLPRE